jgi:outer membrane murein-binding lipoprotein Lpp
LQQIAANEQELARRKEECERDLDTIRSELEKIKSSRAAAIEAQLREQEIKDQATFYTL